MPERGPVQHLLPFFQPRATRGWRVGLAVTFIALLCLVPGEESVFHKAKAGLTQSLRQAAWTHALAGEPERTPWPWDVAAPSAGSPFVPRLGLSAAVLYDGSGQRSELKPFSRSWRASLDRHDPHLVTGDVAIGDGLPVTAAKGITPAHQVAGRETLDAQGPATDALPAGASDPHLACPRHSSSFAGALRFLIEGAHIDPLESQATLHEQKL